MRYHSARRNGFEIFAGLGLAELASLLPHEARRCTFVSADLYAVENNCWG
jgi:hypothetical protein